MFRAFKDEPGRPRYVAQLAFRLATENSREVRSQFEPVSWLCEKEDLKNVDKTHLQHRRKIQPLSSHSIDASVVQLALTRVELSRISYWDALIVEAALRSGATTLYSEDMQHGTRYSTLELVNPFLA